MSVWKNPSYCKWKAAIFSMSNIDFSETNVQIFFLTLLQLFTICGKIGQHEMSTLGTGGCGTQDRLVDPSRKVPVKQVAPNTNGIHP